MGNQYTLVSNTKQEKREKGFYLWGRNTSEVNVKSFAGNRCVRTETEDSFGVYRVWVGVRERMEMGSLETQEFMNLSLTIYIEHT